MPSTTNFGWTTPADTDLVKDGASAIRTLGNGIDTTLVDLKGGTTGQVLSKNSNTDMDFTWVAQDDSNAIQNAIVDAKGDLISATAADTPARLAVGADGTYLQADSTTATGLKWGSVSAGSMTLISTTTLTGSSVSLSSIPSTYNNLYLVVQNFRPSTNTELRMRFNGDSTANRHFTIAYTSATNLGFDSTSGYVTQNQVNGGQTSYGLITITIPNYTNTATWKQANVFALFNGTSSASVYGVDGSFIGYNQTSAISSLDFFPNSGTFTTGTILLYGVK